MASPTLLPDPTCLRLTCFEMNGQMITAVVSTTAGEVLCPLCQCRSTRIHSRYTRLVADLPWMGCALRLQLHTRRFFCLNAQCPRQIFTERLPGVVAPYARRTTRLTDVFILIGFALGGEAGKRLVAGMGLATSPDTLLRLIRIQPESHISTPRVLGVDDFSFCRRRTYGTILIDLEKRVPVDLLPDREAETLAKWLLAHPGVEIISRDRGGDYAKGARLGAPQAQQIADRFHLLVNLSDALEGLFLNKKTLLKEAMPKKSETAPDLLPSDPWHLGRTKQQEAKSLQQHQERVERYHKIHDLYAKKVDTANIARQVGMSRRLVYHYLHMKHPPERTRIQPKRKPLIEPYKDYILQRWNEGCRSAKQIAREITEQGYTGSSANVSRFLAPLRAKKGKARSFKQVEPSPETLVAKEETEQHRPPTAKQVARWMTFKEKQLLDWQKTYRAQLLQADPIVRETYDLVQSFANMLRERQGEHLDAWLTQVEAQGVSELKSFAQGLKKDYDAVKAGLTQIWSQGPVEGHVHRLKLLKRQAYGRASFDQLRKRVLQCS